MTRLACLLRVLVSLCAMSIPAVADDLDDVPASMRVGPSGRPLDDKERRAVLERKVVSQLLEAQAGGPRPGQAITIIDASPKEIFGVLRDYDHFHEFMPYVVRATVDDRGPGRWVVSYVVKPPLGIGARTYQLLALDEHEIIDGRETLISRVEYTGRGDIVSSSSTWHLVPISGGRATFVRYWTRTDPGGSFTPWLKERIASAGMPKVLEAVRKRVVQLRKAR